MSLDRTLVAIPCKLSPGAFSGERIFEVKLANGETYSSLAPRQFCWTSAGKIVSEKEPTATTDGMIAARIVASVEGDQLQVEVPDGEVIAVDKSIVQSRPTVIAPPSNAPATS